MSTLIIIGGSGFFGQSFLDYFNRKSFQKWGIDNIFVTSRSIQKTCGHQTIIFNSKEYKNIPEADYIIYAASSNNQNTYITSPQDEINEQYNCMDCFYEIINSFKNKPKKILYTSSGAVYGQSNLNNKITSEISTICNPDDNNEIKKNYANIKINWEDFLLKNFSDISIIARCFAFVGPRLPLDKHFVIGNFIDDYLHNRNINVKSKNRVYRSYMYSDDLVEWLLTMLTFKKTLNNKIYNVGSDEEIEIHDLANVFKELSSNSKQDFQPDNLIIERYVPNIDLAHDVFNLRIKFNLMQSIRNTLNHHSRGKAF